MIGSRRVVTASARSQWRSPPTAPVAATAPTRQYGSGRHPGMGGRK